MDEPGECVLEFEAADLVDARSTGVPLREVRLRLEAGQLALIEAPTGIQELLLPAAAEGLLRPAAGFVRYLEVDWRERGPLAAQRARHTIGHVFEGTEWVSNLNVDENVLLASCHHTHRPEAELVEEALALARRFGLEELTSKRPNLVGRQELRACALVRAFLDTPRLVLLERPLRGVARLLGEALAALVSEYRASGGAVLWISSEVSVLRSETLLPDHRFVLEPPALRAEEGARA